MPTPRLFITGWGLITPLGLSSWETFAGLLAGRCITDRAASLPEDVVPMDLVRVLGSVGVARSAVNDPAIDLAERAAREALFMAGSPAVDVPIFVGASKGAVHALTDAADLYQRPDGAKPGRDASLRSTDSEPHTAANLSLAQAARQRRRATGQAFAIQPPAASDAALAVALGPLGYLTHHLRRRLGCGEASVSVAACASSLVALHQARLALLSEGGPQRVLVITSEAALLPMFVHSYERLGVLPPLDPQRYRGRPLDRARSGFVLSEVAAAVVLERSPGKGDAPSQPTASPRSRAIELLDTATASESYDILRTSPDMPALHHVASALLSRHKVRTLHPHATGTLDHDPAELSVYQRILSHQPIQTYACKGALGHGLGAAGLTALVIACLSATTNRLPPMPWLTDPISPSPDPRPQTLDPINLDPHHPHAIFAAGFGGHVAGAVIQAGR